MNNINWNDYTRTGFELVMETVFNTSLNARHADKLARRLANIHPEFRTSIDKVIEKLHKLWAVQEYPKTVISIHPQDLTNDLCRRICNFWHNLRLSQRKLDSVFLHALSTILHASSTIGVGILGNAMGTRENDRVMVSFSEKNGLMDFRWWLTPHEAAALNNSVIDLRPVISIELKAIQFHRKCLYGICVPLKRLYRYDATSIPTNNDAIHATPIGSRLLPKELMLNEDVEMGFIRNIGYVFQTDLETLYLFDWQPDGSCVERLFSVATDKTPNDAIDKVVPLPTGNMLIETAEGWLICISPNDLLSGKETKPKWERPFEERKWTTSTCANGEIMILDTDFEKQDKKLEVIDGETGKTKSSFDFAYATTTECHLDMQIVDDNFIALLFPDKLTIVDIKSKTTRSHRTPPTEIFRAMTVCETGKIAVAFESNSPVSTMGIQLFEVDKHRIVCLQRLSRPKANRITSLDPETVKIQFQDFAFIVSFQRHSSDSREVILWDGVHFCERLTPSDRPAKRQRTDSFTA